MARNRKKRKPRKGGNRPQVKVFDSESELKRYLGATFLKSIKEDSEVLETDFGPIKISEGAALFGLRNKGAFVPVTSIGDRIDEEDSLELLLEYERLNQEFPEEPFIHVQIADCYKHLEREEKYKQKLADNYFNYKGDPLVDVEFASNVEDMTPELYTSIFGTTLNIHERYPKHKIFDPYIVLEFYAQKANYLIALEDYDLAKQCIAIVKQIDARKARMLDARVSYYTDPAFRRKAKLMKYIFFTVVLAVLAGVIWGIVQLFRWLF